VLLRNTQNHMSRVRKDSVGASVNLERDIQEVMDKLPGEFPKSLTIQEQGRFAIGYYHQTQARYAKKDAADANDAASGTDTQDQGDSE
jgi:CRISPR-associated protein Csd1